ncbi:MAG: hypothetical protein HY791_17495 [Deltaproteobacteria bacterium]|nr:hypothetical protein [Deltaproteobacteria bacterium]
MSPTLDAKEIYFVRSDHDPTALLARRAGIRDGWVFWDDTTRERAHRVSRVAADGPHVVVYTDSGWVYAFRPLTLDLYDVWVKRNVELSPEFHSTHELKTFYRQAAL